MIQDTAQVLPYATAAARSNRFRHVLAVIPFAIGLALGGIFAGIEIVTAPPFARSAGFMLELSVFFWLCATVAIGLYALVVLFLIGCFSTTVRTPASMGFVATFGFSLPAFLSALMTWSTAIGMILMPLPALTHSLLYLASAVMLSLTLASPFLLVRWRDAQGKTPLLSRQIYTAMLRLTIAAAALGCVMWLGWRYAWRRYDIGCRQVAAWVKSTYAAPGNYADLALPPSLSGLSEDHNVSAVVFADGRVAVMLTTFAGGHTTSEYIVYCTGPIAPAEIGPDAYGRPAVLPGQLPMHFIENQIDSQHFEVAFDLG